MEYDSAVNIKSFLVDIGNMSDSGTYKLYGNTTSSFTSPAFSTDLTVTDTCLFADLDETYQYWQLSLTDSSITKIQIGYLQMGDAYLQMPGIKPTATLSYKTTSSRSMSISGQVYGDIGYNYLETSFNFPFLDDSRTLGPNGWYVDGRVELKSMWEQVQNMTPVWILLWANDLDLHPPVFSVFNQTKLGIKKLRYDDNRWQVTLKVLEVK